MANLLMILALLDAGPASGTTALDGLRERARVSTARAEGARDELDRALQARDRAEGELRRHQRDRDPGFLARRRIRSAAARVRERVEETVRLSAEAAAADDDARRHRAMLRHALFESSAAAGNEADAAAREGRSGEAAGLYTRAAALLAEAARWPEDPVPAEPWAGLDVEIPLAGNETPAERSTIAEAYRRSADALALRLAELARRLDSAETAVTSYERLSRFRGVLERAGGPVPDPTTERDRIASTILRGREIEMALRSRALAVEKGTDGGGTVLEERTP